MQQIGELFLLRMNINLVGSVLDSPVSPYPMYVSYFGSLTHNRPSTGGILGKFLILLILIVLEGSRLISLDRDTQISNLYTKRLGTTLRFLSAYIC